MTLTSVLSGNPTIGFGGTSNQTLNTAGITLATYIVDLGFSGTLSLLSDVTVSGQFVFGVSATGCTRSLVTNNYSITASTLEASISTQTVTLGSSLITITGNDTSSGSAHSCAFPSTVSAGTSTLKFTDATANAKTIYSTGAVALYNIWLSGAGTGTFDIALANGSSCNEIKADTPPHTIRFTASTTFTVKSFNIKGVAGSLMTISSITAATHTLSCASGLVSCDYLSVTNSIATGGARWFAGANSTNVSGNKNWRFTSANYRSALSNTMNSSA